MRQDLGGSSKRRNLVKNVRGAPPPATTSFGLVNSRHGLKDSRSGLVIDNASIITNARRTVASLREESDEVLVSLVII